MKSTRSRRWRVGLWAIVLAAGCQDTLEPEEGALVGRWDGHLWVGDARAMLLRGTPQGDVLYVFGTAPRGAGGFSADESIRANVVFRGAGVYALGPDDVSFLELTGGDVIAAEYRGFGSPAGRLTVSRYDEMTGAIEGELSFSARATSTFASYGHTARLTDGKFRTVVTVQSVNTGGR